MLSDQARPLIAATLPLVGERIEAIAANFYQRMFAAHPELMDGMFSRSNQKNGTQQKALAGSIAAFAAHMVNNPGTYPETVLARIAHKHVSLGVQPEQYEIVYKYLFEAIAEELADVITSEIAGAWTDVYWLMAHALIKIENGLYAATGNDAVWAQWTVVAKEAVGVDAISFTLEPADDTPAAVARPGQYVSVMLPVADGLRQIRQYTLSGDAVPTPGRPVRRVFTAKLDRAGEVTPMLHEQVSVGDQMRLSNPCGDVTLGEGEHPLVLASAGIGCTPSASILRSLVEKDSTREVLVLHADRTLDHWALKEQMRHDAGRLNADLRLWLEEPLADAVTDAVTDAAIADRAGAPGFNQGFMTLTDVAIPANAAVYLCGPLPFMQKIRSEALASGVPAERIHYEVFGPDLWLAA